MRSAKDQYGEKIGPTISDDIPQTDLNGTSMTKTLHGTFCIVQASVSTIHILQVLSLYTMYVQKIVQI